MTVMRDKIRGFLRISLYRNAAYLLMTSGTNSLAGFVFWAMAARLYPAEGVGLASAAISAMGLLALLSTLGMDYGLIRFLPGAHACPAPDTAKPGVFYQLYYFLSGVCFPDICRADICGPAPVRFYADTGTGL